MWLNRSTRMNSVTSTEPARADLGEVVAGEVDEHEVLGLLLGVGDELGLEVGVLLGRRAARLRAGDRVREDAAVLHLHERLGRGADDPVRLAGRRRRGAAGTCTGSG